MSPTQKAARKPARRQSTAARSTPAKGGGAEHARFTENERVIRHVTDSLEVAQADLAKLRANLGAGVGDAHKNLSRLLRDAAKLSRATRKDLQRLQKDMLAAAKAAPKRAGAGKRATAAKATSKRTAAKAAPNRAGAKAAPKRTAAKAAPNRAGAKAAPKRTTAKAPPKRAASKPRSTGAGRAR
jgi:hypothetical protein